MPSQPKPTSLRSRLRALGLRPSFRRLWGSAAELPSDFDAEAYLRLNRDVEAAGVDPVHHYLRHGHREGRPYRATDVPATTAAFDAVPRATGRRSLPADFDPATYLLLNPDLRLAGVDPSEHYRFNGHREGRTYRFPEPQVLEGVPIDAARQTVLLVSHDATRSGAPILSLNIAQHLRGRYNVVVLLLGRGALIDDFRDSATAVVLAPETRGNPTIGSELVGSLCRRYDFLFALVNSIESRVVLQGLAERRIAAVSLLHEFAAYTRPRDGFTQAFLWSTHVVFSARLTLENALAEHAQASETLSTSVIPQGRCIAPRNVTDPGRLEAERTRLARAMRPPGAGTDAFVVLGAGSVQYRKGVDLFIECATRVVGSPGGERCRFVWVGHGYNPGRDVGYSVYLADQVRRAGLTGHVVFVDEVSDIEFAYELADVLLLSSRLDPLPNVGIDALCLGKPVVCFDETTGIADFLIEHGLRDETVARYIDTADMAAKLLAMARSPAFTAAVGARCRQAALASFDMPRYVDRIEAIARAAVEQVRREADDAETLLGSGRFEAGWSTPPREPATDDAAAVTRYIRSWRTGVHPRRPHPGFHPGIYAQLNGIDTRSLDPFAAYLRRGSPQGPWNTPVIGDRDRAAPHAAAAPGPAPRVALHIHAYYPSMVPAMLERLALNRVRPDLYVSVRDEASARDVEAMVARLRMQATRIAVVPNRGRDIGPMLTAFGPVLSGSYDFVGHVHTKRSPDIADEDAVSRWFDFLMENLLGGPKGGAMADTILERLRADPGIAIVFPADPNVVGWTANRPYAEPLAQRLGLPTLPQHLDFPVGTMFWIRAAHLARLVGLGLDWDDYPPEPLPYDGSMLHAIERLFGALCQDDGSTIATTVVRGVTR